MTYCDTNESEDEAENREFDEIKVENFTIEDDEAHNS
jgi:hypothetical protein